MSARRNNKDFKVKKKKIIENILKIELGIIAECKGETTHDLKKKITDDVDSRISKTIINCGNNNRDNYY